MSISIIKSTDSSNTIFLPMVLIPFKISDFAKGNGVLNLKERSLWAISIFLVGIPASFK